MVHVLFEQTEIADFGDVSGVQVCADPWHGVDHTQLDHCHHDRLSLVESVTHIAQLVLPTQLNSVNSDRRY